MPGSVSRVVDGDIAWGKGKLDGEGTLDGDKQFENTKIPSLKTSIHIFFYLISYDIHHYNTKFLRTSG